MGTDVPVTECLYLYKYAKRATGNLDAISRIHIDNVPRECDILTRAYITIGTWVKELYL